MASRSSRGQARLAPARLVCGRGCAAHRAGGLQPGRRAADGGGTNAVRFTLEAGFLVISRSL